MNGFLFNAGLIVLSSVAIVQFAAQSFSFYLRLTPIIRTFAADTYLQELTNPPPLQKFSVSPYLILRA